MLAWRPALRRDSDVDVIRRSRLQPLCHGLPGAEQSGALREVTVRV